MKYEFTDIFDIPILTKACEAFTRYSGMGTAILDLDGHIHVATGWQSICTKFHRVHPTSSERCKESDTELANLLQSGQRFNIYRCKNGLVDVAIPLFINEEHAANFFTGQFLLEEPDLIYFESQADKFEFDKPSYLEALNSVPVFDAEHVKKTLNYLVDLTQLFGQLGYDKQIMLETEQKQKKKLQSVIGQRTAELVEANNRLEVLNGQLKKMSNTDGLTGLNNRVAFDYYLDKEWQRLARTQGDISLLIIDIDHFKHFNDYYGHVAGDNCLIEVATQLTRSMRRPTDFVARYGGEEFVCLLPDTDLEGALSVAKIIQENINNKNIPHEASGVAPHITLSIGVASHVPGKFQDKAELILEADKYLYQAKDAGRNCIISHNNSDD